MSVHFGQKTAPHSVKREGRKTHIRKQKMKRLRRKGNKYRKKQGIRR